jgi:hypothetical protein
MKMGMYDELYINKDKLPLSEAEKEKIKDNQVWQTNNFDNLLTEIIITDDGKIKINKWEIKEVPKKDRKYPNDEGWRGLLGSLKRINERWEFLDYHGEVIFGNGNYEFGAFFKNGKMIDIYKKQ